MIFISILTLIVAKALPSFKTNLSSIYFTRISAIIFIYAGALSFNSLYIQSIGSGIGIYSGLFHVTQISQIIEIFLLIIGSLILIAWPQYQSQSQLKTINSPSSTHSISLKSFKEEKSINYSADYSLIVLFSTLGSCLLISSSDLISMYLSIELQSFGLYVLATLYRDSESSTSAGLKYFLLGGLSSCLILLGAGLIYAFTGLTNFESIYSLVSVYSSSNTELLSNHLINVNNLSSVSLGSEIGLISGGINLDLETTNILQGLSLGLILIVVGFLFKIAAAPLHNWSPDVYDDTPTIVTIWLTIMPKIAILILLLELHTQIGVIGGFNSLTITINGYVDLFNSISTKGIIGENSIYLLKNLLLISSLLSLIIGTVVGLAQTRIKRLLAYSTISHIGFILLALAINTEQSIDSLLFYIIQYTITNLNVFLIIIALSYIINNSVFNSSASASDSESQPLGKGALGLGKDVQIKDIRFISELKGQFFINPLLSLSLAICLFSMAGIPPLMGFFSKQFVLYSAVQSGYYFISFVAILVSVVSASYYLKIIRVLYTESSTTPTQALNLNPNPEQKNHFTFTTTSETENITTGTVGTELGKGLGLEKNSDLLLTNFHSFLISSLTLSILFFILKPSLILNSTQLLSLSLFNI